MRGFGRKIAVPCGIVVSIALAGLGCGAAQETQSPGITPTAPPLTPVPPATPFQAAIHTAKMLSATRNVAIAIVTDQGEVFPERLVVRQNVHHVLWIGNGESLSIAFKPSSLFPVKCQGAICWMPTPPNKTSPPDGFPYGGDITVNGVPTHFDPSLEVVK